MQTSAWTRCTRFCLLLMAVLRMGEVTSRANSIKAAVLGQHPSEAANRSTSFQTGVFKKGNYPKQVYPCSNDKECSVGSYCHAPQKAAAHCANCKKKKKRCNRDSMCCPGNRCSNHICLPVSESLLSPHIPALEDHNELSAKRNSWKKSGKIKTSQVKGHEGETCLRSSDCVVGHCCARHFWTKMCKPVLQQGEVCTRQRRKGSHGLELFQRCDCAKGLSCKVWKDATSSSRSRLHVCQRL